MPEQNIVILGASWGGLSVAHYFLKHVAAKLPKVEGTSYKVVLISPSAHYFYRVAGPRIILSADAFPQEKYLIPLADHFKQYPAESYSLIQGKATSVDTAARIVSYQPHGVAELVAVPYHALVIATGFSTSVKAWNNEGDVSEIKAALDEIRGQVNAAKTIVIAGGGPAGVETGGEVGFFKNGTAGWFQSRLANPKTKITLYQADDKLLPILRPALAKKAEVALNKVGVDVVYNTKVISHELAADGTTTLQLSTGETISCDLYIGAVGGTANTSFLPSELVDGKGRVSTNPTTLRVDAAGPRVYAVGDVGSYTRGGVMSMLDAIPVALTNIERDLTAFAAGTADKDSKPSGPDREFKDNLTETQFVPVGGRNAVGAAFGWKLPSLMVWLVKGRDFMIWNAGSIPTGSQWKAESKWKQATA